MPDRAIIFLFNVIETKVSTRKFELGVFTQPGSKTEVAALRRDFFYIGQHEIDDDAAFADYLKQTMPFIEKHGGRYLTKAGTHEILEGQRPSRVVVVEFPSKQAIKEWYNDPGYRPLVAKRHAAARSIMIALEGQ